MAAAATVVSTLYQLVQAHSATLFAQAEAVNPGGGGYPKYVKDEVSAYLRCGILSYGFARLACESCGHERIVPYS